ncbi:MAG: VWA-like domain-containing protein [Lachnospiraceae bacterium]|nr:VWA-like domain-containing protein [Lachnospiraceae bacterium]
MEKIKYRKIAAEVFETCRNQIYFQLRYLEHAIFYLRPEEKENTSIGSDGKKLYYGADFLLQRYLQSPDAVDCDYLHTIFHCLYQHPLQANGYDRRYWDPAADIAVTDVIGELLLTQITCEIPAQCFTVIARLKKEVPMMSAPHIARYLMMEEEKLEETLGLNLEEIGKLFVRDDHAFWNYRKNSGTKPRQNPETEQKSSGERTKNKMPADMNEMSVDTPGRSAASEPQTEAKAEQKAESGSGSENDSRPEMNLGVKSEETSEEASEEDAGVMSGFGTGMGPESETQLREDWNEIAENVMLSAQSFAKSRGDLPGCMVQTLQRLTRETYDYTDFLKKFAVLEECMKLNPDEFDYLYYLYGLNRLGRIALVEPLEYKEEYLVHDFVIAIDTSGSCSGALVQRFLNKTYNILKSTESFSRKVVIHLIQCDCVIQDDVVIESLDDLESYTEHLEIKGLGGTDFRPVFAYVDELCAKKAFRDLRGLIYFTDGYGVFPGRPPRYRTAFVFVDREDQVQVPPWAMRMYLNSECC